MQSCSCSLMQWCCSQRLLRRSQPAPCCKSICTTSAYLLRIQYPKAILGMLLLRSIQQRLETAAEGPASCNTTHEEQALLQMNIHQQLRSVWSPDLQGAEHLLWSLLCQESGQQLYSLAQRLSAVGEHTTADVLLSHHLGYRFRLSNCVWSQSRTPSALTQDQAGTHSNKRPRDQDAPPRCTPLRVLPTHHTHTPASISHPPSHSLHPRPISYNPTKHEDLSHDLQTDQLHVFQHNSCALSSALVLECPLSSVVQKAVAAALDPQSRYWQDHQYGEHSTPFFSYLFELATFPTDIIGRAVTDLAAALRRCPLTCAAMGGVVAAEWWAHCRDPGDSHQLHFDMDERKLGQGRSAYSLRHPLLSSVLFMGDIGGPTLVLDQNPLQPSGLADRAWAVHPAPGRYLVFPGDLLHGVLPGFTHSGCEACTTTKESDVGSHSNRRVTLVVAWWGPDILSHPPPRTDDTALTSIRSPVTHTIPQQPLHACMTAPDAAAAQPTHVASLSGMQSPGLDHHLLPCAAAETGHVSWSDLFTDLLKGLPKAEALPGIEDGCDGSKVSEGATHVIAAAAAVAHMSEEGIIATASVAGTTDVDTHKRHQVDCVAGLLPSDFGRPGRLPHDGTDLYFLPPIITPAWQALCGGSGQQEVTVISFMQESEALGAGSVDFRQESKTPGARSLDFWQRVGVLGAESLDCRHKSEAQDAGSLERVSGDDVSFDTPGSRQECHRTQAAQKQTRGTGKLGQIQGSWCVEDVSARDLVGDAMAAAVAGTLPPFKFFLVDDREIHDTYVMHAVRADETDESE